MYANQVTPSSFSIQNKISNAVVSNEFALGNFFDLAKAFDTVNYNIIFNELGIYGIRGAL